MELINMDQTLQMFDNLLENLKQYEKTRETSIAITELETSKLWFKKSREVKT